jgi:DnaJ family protein A protein 2
MVQNTKLYDILGVTQNASEDEIKKAYKGLSKEWHPDKNQHRVEEATKKFQEITEAYAILSDKDKRRNYDTHGTMEDMPNFDPSDIFASAFGGNNFRNMFGSNFNPFGSRQSQEDIIVEQNVTLDDIYNMKKINIKYKQKVFCVKCNGSGSRDGRTQECSGCNGNGQKVRVIKQGPMIQQMVSMCDECGGSGEKVSKNNLCETCNGNKYTLKDSIYEFQLNRNISNNNKIMIENMGHQLKNKKTNLIIVIKEQPHPVFKRNGKDLHVELKIRLYQALYGFTKMLTHLDGRNILLKYEKMLSKMNTMMLIKNEGLGGNLIIHLHTMMPKLDRLEENENTLLKKLLVKAHLAEYQKEQTIMKNIDKMHQVKMDELDTEDEDENHQDNNEQPQGVQCATQ